MAYEVMFAFTKSFKHEIVVANLKGFDSKLVPSPWCHKLYVAP